ncbi:hypothetical protein DBV15_02449 [Temnothorax longispinosus]|uniref:Uncharacterized protein n=1 Tax=Temnothorax longispinosus TaxID=300112 RepID=A0A4S2L158_9HYME|nr:hypothetical protein DBV15_02449 [Temnothorax longispinosus]
MDIPGLRALPLLGNNWNILKVDSNSVPRDYESGALPQDHTATQFTIYKYNYIYRQLGLITRSDNDH